jgi:hypothetical protein
MTKGRDELDQFKLAINLSEYAAAQGYVLDRAHSSRNSVAMKSGTGDKIIIARDERSRHWIYFSVTDDRDNGTIIDFLDRRQRWSLGDIRKELRPWIGTAPGQLIRPQADLFQQEVIPVKRDRAAVVAQFAAMTPLSGAHLYLEQERGLPPDILHCLRFSGRIYTDRYKNAVFPHHDRHGVCGFEIRNYRFRGFAKGGEKGLWYSNSTPEDTALVITESAIDGLSYHALHRPEKTRYFSIAGEMNPMQRELLSGAMKKLPQGGTVITATDCDSGGAHLAQSIRDIADGAERPDLGLIEHRPEKDGQDWNGVLKDSLAPGLVPSGVPRDLPKPRAKP